MKKPLLLALILASLSPALADWPTEKEAFARAYATSTPEDRVAAVHALKDIDHPEGMALVLECYQTEKDPDVRRALADAMNRIRNVRARDVFRETILKHPDAETRVKFCAVFADARMVDRYEMMRFLLRDPSEAVRARALRNLGPSDTALVADTAKLAADPSAEVRMAACGALAAIQSKDAVPTLIALLEKETNREIRWGAVDALQKISGQELAEDVAAWKKWWSGHRVLAMSPVEKALFKGGEWLKEELPKQFQRAKMPMPGANPEMKAMQAQGIPLMVYAMIHAGVDSEEPSLKEGLAYLEEMPLARTYDVACAAMALADHGSREHRDRLAEMAQWLVDQQCSNGQWSYGSWFAGNEDTGKKKEKTTKSDGPKGEGDAKADVKKIAIRLRPVQRAPMGDNSNTQYAILGLRACATECDLPKQTWQTSLAWFRKAQGQDGSWSYGALPKGAGGGYGSMTVGGLASVVICMRALGMDDALQLDRLKADAHIRAGMDWIEKNFSVTKNPPTGAGWYRYYLYGLERAGMVLGVDTFGDHDWYKEGSEELIKSQREDGSWSQDWGPAVPAPVNANGDPWDTSFAILFLKKATRGYTQSGAGK